MAGLSDTVFRSLADQTPSPMFVTSGETHQIDYANPAAARLVGADATSLLGRPLAAILPSLGIAVLAQVQRTRQQTYLAAQPLDLPGAPGPTWWDISCLPLEADGDEPTLVLTTARDATARVLAEQAAEVERATLDALMAHIPEGITIARGPGVHVERISAYGLAMTGRLEAELTGTDARARPETWEVYLPGASTPLPPDERPLARTIAAGEVMSNQVLMLRRPDGAMLPVLCSAGPIRDAAGHITGGVVAWRDIADLHAAERAARHSADRLALALQGGGLGTWESNLDTGETLFDARLAEMLGLPGGPATVNGHHVARFIHPDDRRAVDDAYREAAAAGTPYSAEFRIATADGRERWLASQGIFVQRHGIGVARDITQRRQREERLEQALAERDLFVREADHRIKNSLQLVASMLQLQQSRLSDAEARTALTDAIARVRAVGEAHKSLHQSGDLATVDFGEMLADLCAHIDSLSEAVNVACVSDGELRVDADRAIPLGLIVSELLTNASKHAYPDGAAGTVRAGASATEDTLVVCIADDGVGQVETSNVGGSGLGGSIIRALARQIGTTVDIESVLGQGTSVTLRLPRKAATTAA